MAYFDIYAALQQPIVDNSYFGLSQAQWSFENQNFESPNNSTPWARLTVLPAQPIPREIGAVLSDEINGIAQIDLFYPADKGRGDALAKADEVLAVYRRAAQLTYGDASVRIRTAGLSQGSDNNPWYHVYITIEWVDYRCYQN